MLPSIVTPADKAQATAVAAACLAGIIATPSRADDGRRTVILTAGPWTREIEPHQLQDALAAFRTYRTARPAMAIALQKLLECTFNEVAR